MDKYTRRYDKRAEPLKFEIANLIERTSRFKITDILEEPLKAELGTDGRPIYRGNFGYIGVGSVEVISGYGRHLMTLNEKERFIRVQKGQGTVIIGCSLGGYKLLTVRTVGNVKQEYMVFDPDDEIVHVGLHDPIGATKFLKEYIVKG